MESKLDCVCKYYHSQKNRRGELYGPQGRYTLLSKLQSVGTRWLSLHMVSLFRFFVTDSTVRNWKPTITFKWKIRKFSNFTASLASSLVSSAP